MTRRKMYFTKTFIQWLQVNLKHVYFSVRFRALVTDWTEFVLMVKNVKTKDAGAYQCQVYIAPYGQKDLHMLAILQPFLLKDGLTD